MAGSGTAHLSADDDALLRVEHLVVEFPVGRTGLKVNAVTDVSLDIRRGETLGLVGESGCGKSTTGRAIMQFPKPTAGRVLFDGTDLTELNGEELRRTRTQMQMIFQDPISSLNPRRTIGDIVGEPLEIWAPRARERRSVTTAIAAIIALAIGAVSTVYSAFAFLGSLLAVLSIIALPELAAFGASSALAGILLGTILGAFGIWLLRVGVGLWRRDDSARDSGLLSFGLLVAFPVLAFVFLFHAPVLLAVAAVPLLAMGLLYLPTTRGDFPRTGEDERRRVAEVLDAVGLDPDVAMSKRPHEFSGGQCQRIAIARAVVLEPKVIICDEPVSALDVSVQAQILNLLEDMKDRYQLTLVFIAHDLAVVKNVSDRVAVMYLGKLCEVGRPDDLYRSPAHPYTQALLNSIPVPDPTVQPDPDARLTGELPSPVQPPSGCRFRTRCPLAQDRCAQEEPQMRQVGKDHYVACHFSLVAPGKERVCPSCSTPITGDPSFCRSCGLSFEKGAGAAAAKS